MKKGFCLLLCVLIGLACACREPVLPTFESSESAITSSVPASTAAESQPSASVPEGSSDDNSTVTPLTEEEAPETEEEPANVPAVPDLPVSHLPAVPGLPASDQFLRILFLLCLADLRALPVM